MEKFRVVFIITGLAAMVVLHVALIVWVIFRARPAVAERAGDGGGGEVDADGLSAQEVAQLPCRELSKEADGGECAVCLDALRAGDPCTALPRCGHVFHADCVASWLRKSRRCPVCRADVVEPCRVDTTGAATVEVVTEDRLAARMQ
ncbi:hypothetical protein PR202_gb09692 [Eleusine coracana subsp. coracana]|uniref:RING-type domain-containing protein n=1 Tax=Eleusine coracana subsp. coracana TaxID=191504 RepID=A0AAV5EHW2_ELECO|nr:hypothetical protein PR202_gb09692 [Eleusine coracana subsp. coracana]